jgi:Ca2+-transporting ATPase
MRRPPRRRDEALFGPRQIVLALAQGAGILAGVLALYAWALQSGVGEGAARGAAFVALVFGNLTLALADSASSGRLFAPHRRTYWLIVAAVTTVMTAILGLPPLSELFDLVRPSGGLLALAVAVALLTGGWPAALRVFAPPRPPQPRV